MEISRNKFLVILALALHVLKYWHKDKSYNKRYLGKNPTLTMMLAWRHDHLCLEQQSRVAKAFRDAFGGLWAGCSTITKIPRTKKRILGGLRQ
eukprot:726695-Amphidinium_carterae.2